MALESRKLIILVAFFLFILDAVNGRCPAASFGIESAFGASANKSPVAPGQSPELILRNGKVYSEMDGHFSWTQAVSIRDGIIQSIGSNSEIDKEKGPSTKVVDLKNRVVLSGFNDSHIHLLEGSLSLSRADLTGTQSIKEIQDRLKTYLQKIAEQKSSSPWIFGFGWDHTSFINEQPTTDSKYPTRQEIDAVIADRPVFLWHVDHHQAVVNSKGLDVLGINSKVAAASGGKILKDPQGEPTGVLLESAAIQAANKAENLSFDEIKKAIKAGLEVLARSGITSIQGGPIPGENESRVLTELKVLDELYKSNELTVRYSIWGSLENPQSFATLKEKYKHIPEEWLRFGAVKGFVDGVISSKTAALFEPYSDDKTTKGEPIYSQEKLDELVINANRLGFPVALHAIGDRSVSMGILAFSHSKGQLFNSKLRNRIEHLEVVPAHIYSKFRELGVIASVQPSHLIYDTQAQNYNDKRLGLERAKQAFAWKSFLNEKAHLAFGSDWPVMPTNPMIGLYGAVYRQNFDGSPKSGWQPKQKLSMAEAIEAYTLGGAYATHEEHLKGSLREGKFADLVVLEQDPFKVNSKQLLKNEVFMTLVHGKIVYDHSK